MATLIKMHLIKQETPGVGCRDVGPFGGWLGCQVEFGPICVELEATGENAKYLDENRRDEQGAYHEADSRDYQRWVGLLDDHWAHQSDEGEYANDNACAGRVDRDAHKEA